MSTTVVVLSHQPGAWLRDCLVSVRHQADEVVLIDNGSVGAAASTIGGAAGVTVVRVDRNLGYAGGVNLALQRASGDIVALLNDDAMAAPGWLARAEQVLCDPSVAAVTPKIIRAGWYREVVYADRAPPAPGDSRELGRMLRTITVDGEEVIGRLLGTGIHQLECDPLHPNRPWRWTAPDRPFYVPVPGRVGAEVLVDGEVPPAGPVCRLINKCGGYLRPDGVLGDHGDETPDDGRWDAPAERFFASGTALVARAAVFASLGGLAEPMFAYYEDADWCWRARLAGLRIVYDPGARVEHRHSATSGGAANPWVRRLAARNRVLCLVRNAPVAVATSAIRPGLAASRTVGGQRSLLARLPWAVVSRRQLARGWELRPRDVWRGWAGVDVSWDASPARPEQATGSG